MLRACGADEKERVARAIHKLNIPPLCGFLWFFDASKLFDFHSLLFSASTLSLIYAGLRLPVGVLSHAFWIAFSNFRHAPVLILWKIDLALRSHII